MNAGIFAETFQAPAQVPIAGACKASMKQRRSFKRNHEPVYWWTEEIAEARRRCITARRLLHRSRGRPEFDERRLEYSLRRRVLKKAIRRSKSERFLELCDDAENDTWGLAYKLAVKKFNVQAQTAPKDERKMREIVETLFPGSTNFQPLDPTPTPQLFLEAPAVTVDEILKAASVIRDSKAPDEEETAEHILFTCRRFSSERDELEANVGRHLTVDNMISCMLEKEEYWSAVCTFAA
ncbi:hypothetical protein ACLKA6_005692 [Drosophila palustris]